MRTRGMGVSQIFSVFRDSPANVAIVVLLVKTNCSLVNCQFVSLSTFSFSLK